MAEKIIGLDIGAGSVKAVILSRGFPGRHRIIGVRRIEIHEEGGVAKALSDLFADQAFRGAICVTALSPGLLSFRNIRLPFRDEKRIGQTLAFSLEPLIQQPLEKVFIDYTVTGRAEQAEIFAAVADRAQVTERTVLLAPYVRQTAVIDIEAVPLASFLLQKPGLPECALVLDMGVRDTTAIFAGKGRILHIRHFHFGGETASRAIAAALRIDMAEAEAIKQNGELPEVAVAAVREVRDRFLSELKNTEAFLLDQSRIPEAPSRIILAGGGARMPGIAEGLSRLFSVAVERTDLMTSGGFEIDAALRPSWDPGVMDQALALAVRPMGKGSGFNFHRRESEARADYGELRGRLKKGAAAVLIILILAGVEIGLDDYGARIRLSQLKQEITTVFRKIDPETTRIVDPVVQLRGKITEAKKLAAGMGDATTVATALDLLREISALAPPELLVNSLTLDGDAAGLKGEARNFDAVDTVKKTFANSKYFKTVTIGSTNLMKQGTGVEFDLKVILKK
jgi:Tfp pilus assembly PilM family ATPase